MTMTLSQELDLMHADYVDAVNSAIQTGDVARAMELAAAYDDEAITLMAVRENKTHLLPIRRPAKTDSSLRRLVSRLRTAA